MEVILKQDQVNLGFANDIIKVKDGYARNYLIPKGIAIQATESAKKVLAENIRQRAHKETKVLGEAQTLAQAIEAVTITITAKVGAAGKLYGSVSTIQIADALKAQHNIVIDRKKIAVKGEAIKEVGTFVATANLHRDVKAAINIEVVEEVQEEN